jgi:hypothetical protein
VGNDIAANRISFNPQKLQAMSATGEIGRGSWRKVGQAGRKTWRPCHGPVVDPPWIGRRHDHWRGGMAGARLRLARALDRSGSAAVFRPDGEDEQDQAAWPERAGPD